MVGKLEEIAKIEQEAHREISTKEGIIIEFLDKLVPSDWGKWELDSRRIFLNGDMKSDKELVKRDKVCVLEIWCEAFGGTPKDFKITDFNEIKDILNSLPCWEKAQGSLRFGYCGKQRGYVRKSEE